MFCILCKCTLIFIVNDLNLFIAVIVFETSRTFYNVQCLCFYNSILKFCFSLFILDNSVTETMFMTFYV